MGTGLERPGEAWRGSWRGLERELDLVVLPGDGGGPPGTRLRGHVRRQVRIPYEWPLAVLAALFTLVALAWLWGQVLTWGGADPGFVGRSLPGTCASRFLTVSVGGLDEWPRAVLAALFTSMDPRGSVLGSWRGLERELERPGEAWRRSWPSAI